MADEQVELTDEQKKEQAGKLQKKYEANLIKMKKILGRESLMGTPKAKGDELDEIIDKLLEEQREKNAIEIKGKFTKALDGYADFQKQLKAKEKELEQLKQNKMKEFNKDMDDLFRLVDDMHERSDSYKKALQSTGSPEAPKE